MGAIVQISSIGLLLWISLLVFNLVLSLVLKRGAQKHAMEEKAAKAS